MPPAEHPSLALRVSELERQRATEALSDAYSQGRLDEVELDRRLTAVMTAKTRRDLNASLYGIPPAVRPVRVQPPGPQANIGGGLAHLSSLFVWILGPLLVYAVSPAGSPSRNEAARAFNFQLITGLGFIPVVVLLGILAPSESVIVPLVVLGWWLAWLTLTIVGGVRAFAGQPWSNPVTRLIRWEALSSGGR